MLTQRTRTYIKIAPIEKPLATFYVAFAVVECDGKIVRISNPKLLRIVPKNRLTLTGKVRACSYPCLVGAKKGEETGEESVPSPYVSDFVYFENIDSANLRPRPPTIKA